MKPLLSDGTLRLRAPEPHDSELFYKTILNYGIQAALVPRFQNNSLTTI